MGNESKYPYKPLIVLVLFIIYGIISLIVIWDNPSRNYACKQLGFKEYGRWNSVDICKSSEGDYHFVEIDCETKYFPILLEEKNCKAKEIKIGEVWGTSP